MKIVKMDTNSFWKGEAGVVGLVEDQAHTFKTKLYLKNGQVKDYSCTCEKGNSYRGICAHGEALFAYYKEYQAEMDEYPEAAFFNVGTIDEVVEKAKAMQEGAS